MLNVKSGPAKGDLYTEKEWNTDSKDDQEGAYMHSKVNFCSTDLNSKHFLYFEAVWSRPLHLPV